jgi:hypothetical protein
MHLNLKIIQVYFISLISLMDDMQLVTSHFNVIRSTKELKSFLLKLNPNPFLSESN